LNLVYQNGANMRFLTSKFGLLVIGLIFIFTLVWFNFGVLSNYFSSINSSSAETIFRNNVGEFFSQMLNWIYKTSKPIAAELVTFIQSWWESQKPIIVDQLIKWLTQ